MKKRRKILQALGIIIRCLFFVIVLDLAYIVLRPDMPPFDESALSFNRPKIPDAANGALLLEKAIGVSKTPRKEWFNDYENGVKDKRKPTAAEVTTLKAKYGEKIEQMKDAAYSKYFQEPLPEKTWLNNTTPTDFLSVRDYSKVNSTLAWGDLRKGDEETAMKRMRANLKLANALMSNKGYILCFMIGSSIKKFALSEINAMIDENLLTSETITYILESLKDENTMIIENFKNAMKVQYKIEKLSLEYYLSNPIGRKQMNPYINYFDSRISIRKITTHKIVFDAYKSIYEAADKPYKDIKIAPSLLSAPYHGKNNLFGLLQSANADGLELAYMYVPRKGKYIDVLIIIRTENELFRTKAAIALYRLKYGKLPEKLDELVPEFLGSIPTDPFDGKPVRYNREKGAVYSVGYNLKDDGGAANAQMFDEHVDYSRMNDIILYLSGARKKQ